MDATLTCALRCNAVHVSLEGLVCGITMARHMVDMYAQWHEVMQTHHS